MTTGKCGSALSDEKYKAIPNTLEGSPSCEETRAVGKKRKENKKRKASGKHALIHVTEDRNQYLIPNTQRVSETTTDV